MHFGSETKQQCLSAGLDSTTAMHLVATLRQLAQGGRAVLTTIHQPSSRLYQMLDKLLLLSEGYVPMLLLSLLLLTPSTSVLLMMALYTTAAAGRSLLDAAADVAASIQSHAHQHFQLLVCTTLCLSSCMHALF